jgi:CRISPR/Cas system CSM-associated protein Csm3 (group 7 of RAMP superfamily)
LHSRKFPSKSLKSRIRSLFERLRRESKEHSGDIDVEKGKCGTDLYFFDHGQPNCYSIVKSPPKLTSDFIAQHIYDTFTKFWAEIFGYFNLFTLFVATFFIQLLRFVEI